MKKQKQWSKILDWLCRIFASVFHHIWRHDIPTKLKIPIKTTSEQFNSSLIRKSTVINYVNNWANYCFPQNLFSTFFIFIRQQRKAFWNLTFWLNNFPLPYNSSTYFLLFELRVVLSILSYTRSVNQGRLKHRPELLLPQLSVPLWDQSVLWRGSLWYVFQAVLHSDRVHPLRMLKNFVINDWWLIIWQKIYWQWENLLVWKVNEHRNHRAFSAYFLC